MVSFPSVLASSPLQSVPRRSCRSQYQTRQLSLPRGSGEKERPTGPSIVFSGQDQSFFLQDCINLLSHLAPARRELDSFLPAGPCPQAISSGEPPLRQIFFPYCEVQQATIRKIQAADALFSPLRFCSFASIGAQSLRPQAVEQNPSQFDPVTSDSAVVRGDSHIPPTGDAPAITSALYEKRYPYPVQFPVNFDSVPPFSANNDVQVSCPLSS